MSQTRRFVFLGVTLAVSALGVGACLGPEEVDDDYGWAESRLSAAARRVRAAQIRDAAHANGIEQGWLLAGIADAETGMSQCHSELTWACEGPYSEDCRGPVVAGAADGPCSIMQGGLGMFQFDAGTFTQTLAREGDRILSIAGNVAAGVDFVTAMVVRSAHIAGVDNRAQAIAWMNDVRVGNDHWEPWIRTVTHYYNGCSPSASCFPARFASYRDHTSDVYSEMGADFWVFAPPTPTLDAALVVQGTSAPVDSTGEAQHTLCAGAPLDFHFELRNTGTATWSDVNDLAPGAFGRAIRLGVPGGTADPFVGTDRVSLTMASSASVGPGASTTFTMRGTAPTTPGVVRTSWRMVDETRTWFGPDLWLSFRVTPCAEDLDLDGFDSGSDCNEMSAAIHPGATELCGDAIDQDCDGQDQDCTPGADTGSPDAGSGDAGPVSTRGLHGSCVAMPGTKARWSWLILLALFPALRRRKGWGSQPDASREDGSRAAQRPRG